MPIFTVFLMFLVAFVDATNSTVKPVTTTPCFDRYPDCPIWATQGFCSNEYYSEARRKAYCGPTCGYCVASPTTSTTPPPCVDRYPDCGVWASQGFCTDEYYSEARRKAYCGVTCSYCRSI